MLTPDGPARGERKYHYTSSSDLALTTCLTLFRVSVTIYAQALCNKLGYSMPVSLPGNLYHCPSKLSQQPRIGLTDMLHTAEADRCSHKLLIVAQTSNTPLPCRPQYFVSSR